MACLFRDCSEPFDLVGDLINRGVLEMEALTYIRVRSIPLWFGHGLLKI
jgi:hypothetical protein